MGLGERTSALDGLRNREERDKEPGNACRCYRWWAPEAHIHLSVSGGMAGCEQFE